jgi:3-dehydro-L-gulonate 2-dehydrogenase
LNDPSAAYVQVAGIGLYFLLRSLYPIPQDMAADYVRILPEQLSDTFEKILLRLGFGQRPAAICAEVFTSNSVDGVYSHGVNRFPRFVSYTKSGLINPNATAACIHTMGGIEQWDGGLGPGPVNAFIATDRAMELAAEHGLGCVAMANTNHWMRGGTYGWRVAKSGFVAINWTNTIANTPAYGASDSKLGNNPLVIAVPYGQEAIVLDMAMSQFSYGAMENYELKNEQLPVAGGYDRHGNISTDPKEIRLSGRTLPIGHWKGAGLSLLLDILAVVLSGGRSVAQISTQGQEVGVSQVFIAIDITKLPNASAMTSAVNAIIKDFHSSAATNTVRYPGEKTLVIRKENQSNGVPVLAKVWQEILSLNNSV